MGNAHFSYVACEAGLQNLEEPRPLVVEAACDILVDNVVRILELKIGNLGVEMRLLLACRNAGVDDANALLSRWS